MGRRLPGRGVCLPDAAPLSGGVKNRSPFGPKVQGSSLEWAGAFYRGYPNNDPPPELSDEAAVKAVSGRYRSGLEALKKKIESGS
jgi:hypothetical protein